MPSLIISSAKELQNHKKKTKEKRLEYFQLINLCDKER